LTAAEAKHYKLNGQPVKGDEKDVQLDAGSYTFVVELP
jgi:hypothetical protein